MAKTTQCLKIDVNGMKFSVVYHWDKSANPFWIYRHTWGKSPYGDWCTERKRIETKFADMRSCLFYLAQQF